MVSLMVPSCELVGELRTGTGALQGIFVACLGSQSPLPSSCMELSIPSEVPMILGGLLGSELGADSASIADKNPPFSTSHLAPVLLPSCAQLGNNRRHKGSQNREHSSMAPLAPEGLECMCQWTRGWRKGVLPSSR